MLFLKESYVVETLGEDNTVKVRFEDLEKDLPVELARYTLNCVLEASRRKVHFNAWAVKVLKGHIRAIRCLYCVKDIGRGYRLEIDRREKNQALEAKSNTPRSLKAKISRNEHNKVNKDREKFGYKIPNNSREALLLDSKNGKTLWADAIAKEMTALERIGVFQIYPPKTKFDKKYGWQFAPMHIVFDMKQHNLRHKARLVVGGQSRTPRSTPHIHLPSKMCL